MFADEHELDSAEGKPESLALAPVFEEEEENSLNRFSPVQTSHESVSLTLPCGFNISLSSNYLTHDELASWVNFYFCEYIENKRGGSKKGLSYTG